LAPQHRRVCFECVHDNCNRKLLYRNRGQFGTVRSNQTGFGLSKGIEFKGFAAPMAKDAVMWPELVSN